MFKQIYQDVSNTSASSKQNPFSKFVYHWRGSTNPRLPGRGQAHFLLSPPLRRPEDMEGKGLKYNGLFPDSDSATKKRTEFRPNASAYCIFFASKSDANNELRPSLPFFCYVPNIRDMHTSPLMNQLWSLKSGLGRWSGVVCIPGVIHPDTAHVLEVLVPPRDGAPAAEDR